MAISQEIWNKAKALFELGYSLGHISLETNISKSAISKKANLENWVANNKLKDKIIYHYLIEKDTKKIICHRFNVDIFIVDLVLDGLLWYSDNELKEYIKLFPKELSYRIMELSKLEFITMLEIIKNEKYFGLSCNKSKGHLKVLNYLKENKIDYVEEKTFKDLKNTTYLRFDFYLPSFNIAIEYQGKQHYEPIEFFGGEDTYLKQVENDNIKRMYCKKNKIKLIEISYLQDDNINNILNKGIR